MSKGRDQDVIDRFSLWIEFAGPRAPKDGGLMQGWESEWGGWVGKICISCISEDIDFVFKTLTNKKKDFEDLSAHNCFNS